MDNKNEIVTLIKQLQQDKDHYKEEDYMVDETMVTKHVKESSDHDE